MIATIAIVWLQQYIRRDCKISYSIQQNLLNKKEQTKKGGPTAPVGVVCHPVIAPAGPRGATAATLVG
jgi:hypothetical protein